MALAAHALITLAEAKAYIPLTGAGLDTFLEQVIGSWSLEIEKLLSRRLVYRAPPEVDGAANIVASVAVSNTALTLAAQPSSAGRTLIVTVTDADNSISAGTIT